MATAIVNSFIPAMKKANEDNKYAFNDRAIPDVYFTGEKKDIHVAVAKLLKEKVL